MTGRSPIVTDGGVCWGSFSLLISPKFFRRSERLENGAPTKMCAIKQIVGDLACQPITT